MMDNVFLNADGSGRSLFCLCGNCSNSGPSAALGSCCSVEMGMACGCRFLVASLLHGTSVTAASGVPVGEYVGKMTQGDGSKWQRQYVRSQTKLSDEKFVPREGQDAAPGSHLVEDTPSLGGNLQELCLCQGWPSGRHETEGGGMADSLAPTVAKAWPVALPG